MRRRFRRRSERTRDGRDRGAEHLEPEGHRRALEVRAREVGAAVVVGEEDRIVADAVQLDLDLRTGVLERVARGARHLGGAAKGVGVLHLLALLLQHLAPVGDHADVRGDLLRARETAHAMDPLVVGGHVRVHDLEGHRDGDVGVAEPPQGVDDLDRAHAGDAVAAVDRRETVARLEPLDRDPGPLQRGRDGQPLALVERLALADQDERELRHRGEVAAGADRSLLAHHGRDAAIEQLAHRLDEDRPDAGVPLAQDRDPRQNRGARIGDRERIAVSGRVAVDDVALELLRLLRSEDRLGQLADPGRDAVHHRALADLPLDELAAVRDALEGGGRQLDRLALPGDAVHILAAEPSLTDADAHRILPGALRPFPLPYGMRSRSG